MDPVALWEQLLQDAESVLRLTAEIARKEEKGISPNETDFNELNDLADSLAMGIVDMNEWIEKGGFSPFQEQRKEHEEKEMEELEKELKSWD